MHTCCPQDASGGISLRKLQSYASKYGGEHLGGDDLAVIFRDFKPGNANGITLGEWLRRCVWHTLRAGVPRSEALYLLALSCRCRQHMLRSPTELQASPSAARAPSPLTPSCHSPPPHSSPCRCRRRSRVPRLFRQGVAHHVKRWLPRHGGRDGAVAAELRRRVLLARGRHAGTCGWQRGAACKRDAAMRCFMHAAALPRSAAGPAGRAAADASQHASLGSCSHEQAPCV